MFWIWSKKPADPLDAPLLRLSKDDVFTRRHLLNGGALVLGRTGSGKTSGTGKAIGEACLRIPKSGGVILAPNPDELPMWRRRFEKYGREEDLVVLGPGHPTRMNFLESEMRSGSGSTKNIAQCLNTIGETVRAGDSNGGDSGHFFQKQQDRVSYNAVEIVKGATGGVDAWDLQKFISHAAQSPEQINSEAWRAGFHCKMLERARSAPVDAIGRHDYALAEEYWLGEWPAMADRTRSSIVADIMGVLHPFNTGVVRELVSTTTNFTVDDILNRGKWLFVDMPPPFYGDQGLLVNGGAKYLVQQGVLRREVGEDSNVVVIWCDESHLFTTSKDVSFLAMCRSRQGCMVYLSQSLPSFYDRLGGGQRAKHQGDALLANFGLKSFHALSCPQTAEWASSLIGKERQAFVGGSTSPEGSAFDQILGRNRFTGSFNEQLTDIVQPREFSRLRTGGPQNDFLCDAILVRSETFSSGANWMITSFSQEDDT